MAGWWRQATPAAVQTQLEWGADLTAWDKGGRMPLHWAALSATPAVVALLFDRGADATLRDRTGKLPFDLAKENAALQGTAVYRRLHNARF